MMPGNQSSSLIYAGIIIIVYEAAIILTFYFAAAPIMMVLNALINSSPYLVPYLGTGYGDMVLFVYLLLFAVAALVPLIWFIIWAYKVESGYRTYRY